MDDDCRARFQAQVNELFRLADEAESCARLLRQEAERYQQALDEGNINEELLKAVMAERAAARFAPDDFRVTDNLM